MVKYLLTVWTEKEKPLRERTSKKKTKMTQQKKNYRKKCVCQHPSNGLFTTIVPTTQDADWVEFAPAVPGMCPSSRDEKTFVNKLVILLWWCCFSYITMLFWFVSSRASLFAISYSRFYGNSSVLILPPLPTCKATYHCLPLQSILGCFQGVPPLCTIVFEAFFVYRHYRIIGFTGSF